MRILNFLLNIKHIYMQNSNTCLRIVQFNADHEASICLKIDVLLYVIDVIVHLLIALLFEWLLMNLIFFLSWPLKTN